MCMSELFMYIFEASVGATKNISGVEYCALPQLRFQLKVKVKVEVKFHINDQVKVEIHVYV